MAEPLAEPAALGHRRLWRSVVRPLAAQSAGDIICDVGEAHFPEGLLATTDSKLHLVAPGPECEPLRSVYADRLTLHDSAPAAWAAATVCSLAVLDSQRRWQSHVEALRELGSRQGSLPLVVLRTGGESVGTLSWFADEGWHVVDLPGLEGTQVAIPPGAQAAMRQVDSLAESLGRAVGNVVPAAGFIPQAAVERIRTAERERADADERRERAERDLAAAEDLVTLLRTLNDAAQVEVADLRHLTSVLQERSAAAADAKQQLERRIRALEDVQAATRADLARVAASQSWRLGHWLTRAFRVLTFRRPGRTDAVARAIERLDAARADGAVERPR